MVDTLIETVPTAPEHILELRDNLREEDVCEIQKFGFSVKKALYRTCRNALMSNTVLIGGKVAAIWGLSGVLLGEVGHPWLLTSPIVEKYPLQFALYYRREVRKMLDHFPVLVNYVDADYTKSVRLLELIGFKMDAPEPLSWAKKGALFRRFEMRASNA